MSNIALGRNVCWLEVQQRYKDIIKLTFLYPALIASSVLNLIGQNSYINQFMFIYIQMYISKWDYYAAGELGITRIKTRLQLICKIFATRSQGGGSTINKTFGVYCSDLQYTHRRNKGNLSGGGKRESLVLRIVSKKTPRVFKPLRSDQ